MNNLTILTIILLLLNNCSLSENPSLWNKKKNLENQKNIKRVFVENNKILSEFNQSLKLDLSKIKIKNKIIHNKNDYGFQKYDGSLNKIGNYKFSKLDNVDQLNFKPLFLKDGIIFFDNKGSIIRYDKNQKILWKSNNYSKSEKKLKPKLNFIIVDENLLVTDSISKYYSININSGELNWIRDNTYPFNSEIKKKNNKIFTVDYKNTLRCFNANDGSECWNLKTEDSFTISNSKYSLILNSDIVVFNNSIGDITAADIVTGLIIWQLPTQSSSIINETYKFKTSKLVSDGKSIFFSNNKSEFYSVDLKTGTTNWVNKVNSNLRPIMNDNLIFTVSNEGYLFVIEKKNGNILRITDLFKNYKIKNRKNIKPIGFAIGNTKLYLANSDGNMIIVDLSLGNIIAVEKIARNFTSKPFIFNQNLFIIKNGSIIQYN